MDEAAQRQFDVEWIAQRAEAIGFDPDRVRQALGRRPLPPIETPSAGPTPARGLVTRLVPRRPQA